MSNNLHDVVKLLLARMKSHPKEFMTGSHRWHDVVDIVRDYATKEENDALDVGLRPIRLQQAHELMMDELLNGDERRHREQEEQDYERNLMNRAQNMLLGHPQAMQSGSYGKPLGIGTATPINKLNVTTVSEDMNALRNIK